MTASLFSPSGSCLWLRVCLNGVASVPFPSRLQYKRGVRGARKDTKECRWRRDKGVSGSRPAGGAVGQRAVRDRGGSSSGEKDA